MTKVVDLSTLAASVDGGDTVAFGGKTIHRGPMAFVRQLLRREVSNLEPVGLAKSLDVDLLIGAGHAAAVSYGYVGFESFGLAPNFRRAVETGEIEAREGTCYTVATALRAAVLGVPSLPVAGLEGSDLLDGEADYLAESTDPFTGESTYAVRRMRPDVAVVHATEADTEGNARFDGADLTENLVAKAARRTVVTAERVVDSEAFESDPGTTDVPGVLVDAVAEVPYGAHPLSCPGSYDYDDDHLETYLEHSRAGDIDSYLRAYLGKDEADYRERAIAGREGSIAWDRERTVSRARGDSSTNGRQDRKAGAERVGEGMHGRSLDPAPETDVTIVEVMTAAIVRRLERVEVAFQGFASPLPTVALRAASERSGVTHLSASGAVNGAPVATPLSTEDARLAEGSGAHFTSPEAFDLAARDGMDVMFVGGAQIDRRGRLNTTVAGSWERPNVKFGGGGGAGSLLPLVREAWAWRTEHRSRSLPAEVDFVTARGNLTYLITPLCEFERRDGELAVVSLHPGVSRDDVRERTGWDVQFASDRRTPLPNEAELELLERVDPDRVRRSGFDELAPIR